MLFPTQTLYKNLCIHNVHVHNQTTITYDVAKAK